MLITLESYYKCNSTWCDCTDSDFKVFLALHVFENIAGVHGITDVTFTAGVPFLITSCRIKVAKDLFTSGITFEARCCQLSLHQLAVITTTPAE